ncbi:hypothetical protein HY68_01320 [Streptomyces sp. AcH 505]|nr:hypothetical protein HY68_01320 [Streptomyces sp. AcH 505]
MTEHPMQIAQARNVFGEVIARARLAGEPTVLINRKREVAVVVSVDFYERALEALGIERLRAEPPAPQD